MLQFELTTRGKLYGKPPFPFPSILFHAAVNVQHRQLSQPQSVLLVQQWHELLQPFKLLFLQQLSFQLIANELSLVLHLFVVLQPVLLLIVFSSLNITFQYFFFRLLFQHTHSSQFFRFQVISSFSFFRWLISRFQSLLILVAVQTDCGQIFYYFQVCIFLLLTIFRVPCILLIKLITFCFGFRERPET